MTQTEARPFMQVSVQIDTPDAPALDGRPVRLVSWTATRFSSDHTNYSIYAHHPHGDPTPFGFLTTVLDATSIDPAIVPDWVPWPPAGWLASLELDRDRIAAMCDAIDAEVYHPEHFANGVWK